MIAGPSDGRWAPPGDWKQVTIFLSPLDVHINRTPVAAASRASSIVRASSCRPTTKRRTTTS